MKKLFLITLLILGFSVTAQVDYTIYDTTNGIQDITPSQIVSPNTQGGYDVYKITNGMQNITPSQIAMPNTYGGYDLYNTTNGIPDITPTQIIVPETTKVDNILSINVEISNN